MPSEYFGTFGDQTSREIRHVFYICLYWEQNAGISVGCFQIYLCAIFKDVINCAPTVNTLINYIIYALLNDYFFFN
jgi:hypothetical protein